MRLMRYLVILTVLLFPLCVAAQPGYVRLYAGNPAMGTLSGDGGPATAAGLSTTWGVASSPDANFYIASHNATLIRKINLAGIIVTVAGGGGSYTSSSLYYASIGVAAGPVTDDAGNVFIADVHKIRRLDFPTATYVNIVNSGGTAGYSGDGGPATAAKVNLPADMYIDATGNMYIADANNHRVRKVNTAGIITTIAGNGTAGFGGDGGLATAAMLNTPSGICGDAVGNIYVSDKLNHRIRKISPSGIISTIAGSGTPGFGGDGGLATASAVRFYEPRHLRMDDYNNLYVADFQNSRVRKVNAGGVISTVVGGGTSLDTGILGANALLNKVNGIDVDANNDLYIADYNGSRVLKMGGAGATMVASCPSFSVSVSTNCSNTQFTIVPVTYSAGLSVKTWFGNGVIHTSSFTSSGIAWLTNTYTCQGDYLVKHVLYNGTIAVDSVTYPYTYQFCRSLPITVYADNNGNCVYNESADDIISVPITFAVDSAGVPIDTVSCTGHLSYDVRGPIGTIYTFHAIDIPAGLQLVCPATGLVNHTLTTVSGSQVKYLGLRCASVTGRDFRLFTSFKAGIHAFAGSILAQNLYCPPSPATLSMHLSPKYINALQFSPTPTTISGTTATWSLSDLSAISQTTFTINARIEKTIGMGIVFGDTVITHYSITPITGDANPSDNMVVRIDTVKAGFDPNDISVSPSGCLNPDQTKLTYTIRFENTGNDTAYNIYVLDTLPAGLEPKSMRILATSARMNTYFKKVGAQTIVRFEFLNIKLPDSTHHTLNKGMFVYTIARNASLPAGSTINHRVSIYFDYNDPVLTNTAENTIGCPVLVNEVAPQARAEVLPNPATNELYIITPGSQYTSCTITNSIGQVLLTESIIADNTKINISTLPAGLYYVTLRGERTEVHKIVKL